ncbi:hypothetical protein [Bradyrhizobium sp.]|uniref:hypothetical protein n=1 Tax=Bradyrhizobium sp. TaxID=376 RepID=UPI003C72D04A
MRRTRPARDPQGDQGDAGDARNRYGDAGQFITQQQGSDERGSNQQNQSGSRFGDGSEDQLQFHGFAPPRLFAPATC